MSCKVCGNGRIEDGQVVDHPFRHPFVSSESGIDPGSAIFNKKKEEPKVPSAVVGRSFGGDPALRLALINAGVITHVQLLAAEQELNDARSSGRPVLATPPTGGDPATDPSDDGSGDGADLRAGHGGGS